MTQSHSVLGARTLMKSMTTITNSEIGQVSLVSDSGVNWDLMYRNHGVYFSYYIYIFRFILHPIQMTQRRFQ